jgi:hypothetical protein
MPEMIYELPLFITVYIDICVIICSQHGSSYVKTNLSWHLFDAHYIPA